MTTDNTTITFDTAPLSQRDCHILKPKAMRFLRSKIRALISQCDMEVYYPGSWDMAESKELVVDLCNELGFSVDEPVPQEFEDWVIAALDKAAGRVQ